MLPCSLVFISGSRHSWWNVPIFRSGKTVWNLPTDPALVSVDFLRKGVDTAPTHADLETWAETGTHSFVVLSRKTVLTDVQYRVHIFTIFYIDVIAHHQLSNTKWTSWDPLTDSQWFPPAFIDQCLQIPWRQGDCNFIQQGSGQNMFFWSENGTFEPKICFIYVLFMF